MLDKGIHRRKEVDLEGRKAMECQEMLGGER